MSKLEGAYGFFDTKDNVHTQSGKVAGCSFAKRYEEHKEGADKGTESLFCSCYPSSKSTAMEGRKGAFENLLQIAYFAYDRDRERLEDDLTKLFIFSPICLEKIERI